MMIDGDLFRELEISLWGHRLSQYMANIKIFYFEILINIITYNHEQICNVGVTYYLVINYSWKISGECGCINYRNALNVSRV